MTVEHQHQHFSKHRAEALSDAVFPIAMTVLVLDLKLPEPILRGQLWEALRADSALWYSVVLTFVITSIFWMMQHRVFEAVEALSAWGMRLTITTLGFVILLPFTTSLLGKAKGDPLAFELYFANMAAIGLTLALKLEVARMQGDLYPGPATARIRQRVWSIGLVMLAGGISARYLPLQKVWVVPISVGAALRIARRWMASRAASHAVVQRKPTEAA